MSTSAGGRIATTPDALDALAELLGTSRRELVAAIVRASHRDWLRQLRKVMKEQDELGEVDPWNPED